MHDKNGRFLPGTHWRQPKPHWDRSWLYERYVDKGMSTGELAIEKGADAIITNPPYGKGNRQAVKFAELALARCGGSVALLLTAKFDFGKTRHHLFRDNPRFCAKIVLVDRIQWFPGESSGTEDHAWYVWGPAPGTGKGQAKIIYEGKP